MYDAYTTVDEDLNELMQSWFWEDYESDSDGIYSAVTHIREKLKTLTYMEAPDEVPGDQEGITWFLTGGGVGNAVLFASTAVEALRAHGIPARYVEGYYLPASRIDADGNAVLNGSHAHAWTEVYFDGVGWLPVDVTPGYYYDAVVLQQMVSAPDAVRKTAALQDSTLGADELTGLDENRETEAKEPLEVVGDVTLALFGAAALVILLGAVVFALMEVARALKLRARTRWYQNASPVERMTEMEQELFRYLRFLGIEASLGWNTEKVDQELTERVEQVETGEYTRACRLLEKTIYGGIDPEPFEERTLHHFLEKLEEKGRRASWKIRLGFRYESLS